jgi:hypothetical protein
MIIYLSPRRKINPFQTYQIVPKIIPPKTEAIATNISIFRTKPATTSQAPIAVIIPTKANALGNALLRSARRRPKNRQLPNQTSRMDQDGSIRFLPVLLMQLFRSVTSHVCSSNLWLKCNCSKIAYCGYTESENSQISSPPYPSLIYLLNLLGYS